MRYWLDEEWKEEWIVPSLQPSHPRIHFHRVTSSRNQAEIRIIQSYYLLLLQTPVEEKLWKFQSKTYFDRTILSTNE